MINKNKISLKLSSVCALAYIPPLARPDGLEDWSLSGPNAAFTVPSPSPVGGVNGPCPRTKGAGDQIQL